MKKINGAGTVQVWMAVLCLMWASGTVFAEDLKAEDLNTPDKIKDFLEKAGDEAETQIGLGIADGLEQDINAASRADQIRQVQQLMQAPNLSAADRANYQTLLDACERTGKSPSQILNDGKAARASGTAASGTPSSAAPGPGGPAAAAPAATAPAPARPTNKDIADAIRANIAARDANDREIQRAIDESPDAPPPSTASPASPAPAPRYSENVLRNHIWMGEHFIGHIDDEIKDLRDQINNGHRGDQNLIDQLNQKQNDRADWLRRIEEDNDLLEQQGLTPGSTTPNNRSGASPVIGPNILHYYDPEASVAVGDDALSGLLLPEQGAANAAANGIQAAQNTRNKGGNAISGQGGLPAVDDGSALDNAINSGIQSGASDARTAGIVKRPHDSCDANSQDPKATDQPQAPAPAPQPACDTPANPEPPEPKPSGHYPGDADGCQ